MYSSDFLGKLLNGFFSIVFKTFQQLVIFIGKRKCWKDEMKSSMNLEFFFYFLRIFPINLKMTLKFWSGKFYQMFSFSIIFNDIV